MSKIKYNASLDSFIINKTDLRMLHIYLFSCLGSMRASQGFSLTPYKREYSDLTDYDHACINLIESVKLLGLDVNINPHNHHTLDLSNVENIPNL